MPIRGRIVNLTLEVGQTQEEICEALLAGTCGVHGYTVTTAGTASLVLTRRYTPTWARLVAIYGLFLFLVSLLAFLIKTTEAISVTIVPVEGGSRVIFSGVGSPEMFGRLAAVMDPMPAREATASAVIRRVSDGPHRLQGDSKVCPDCGESVKDVANVCRFCGYRFDALGGQAFSTPR